MSTIKLYSDAEQFINETYWSDTHDRENKIDIPGIVHSKLIADNKSKDTAYYGHREGVIHVTSLSKCLRGVVHEMMGTPASEVIEARKLGIFRAGNLFEDFIVDSLGAMMESRQTEYVYKYKNLTLVGRDDGIITHDGKRTLLENKSVHSDSFHYRQKEGTLVAWQNQLQIQTYLWLRRILYNDPVDGVFCYISKDDMTIVQAPVKFNQRIIDDIIIPTLDIINEAYTNKNPELAPLPPMVVFSPSRGQYQKNFLCTYCLFHSSCAGLGWVLEATNLVTTRNKELKSALPNKYDKKKKKIELEVVGEVEPIIPVETELAL
jgi:hypothetical protein